MEVALKKQSEIQQIIVSAIASERDTVLQLASDFQFDGNTVFNCRHPIKRTVKHCTLFVCLLHRDFLLWIRKS